MLSIALAPMTPTFCSKLALTCIEPDTTLAINFYNNGLLTKGLTINHVAVQNETLQLSYTTFTTEEVKVKIYNMAGQLLYNQTQSATAGVNTVSVQCQPF